MNRILMLVVMTPMLFAGCGEEKPLKPASGGGGSTTSATIKVAPKGEPTR